MQLRDAIDDGSVSPLTRLLEEVEQGVWVQGREVYGIQSEELKVWEETLRSSDLKAARMGLSEVGEEEGERGFTTRDVAFDSEQVLWYLRRLHYSMYLHSRTLPAGTWCGGKQEIQELLVEMYGVDVHLHSFIPLAPNSSEVEEQEEETVEWEWKTDSMYPRSTLPDSTLLPPERPLAALHLCLCGNHFWAAAHDSDIWEVNNFNLSQVNYTGISDDEYMALPEDEKNRVVTWDRYRDPTVKMYLDSELPDNFTNDDYHKFTVEDDTGVLDKALEEMLEDEDPYWLYMWNETFKAGLKWDAVSDIEWDPETGAPVEWESQFDWEGYVEYRKTEEARTNLVYVDGSSPPRSTEDLKRSIKKLEVLFDRKSRQLVLAQQAIADGGNITGQSLEGRQTSLDILRNTISEWKFRLGMLNPIILRGGPDESEEGDDELGGVWKGGVKGGVEEEVMSDNDVLRNLAAELGGTYLNFDDLPPESG